MIGLDLAKNFLQLGECQSFSERVECQELEETLQEKFSERIFVAWQIQSVVWGKFDGEKLLFAENLQPNVDD